MTAGPGPTARPTPALLTPMSDWNVSSARASGLAEATEHAVLVGVATGDVRRETVE